MYRFDDFLADPETWRLSRGGQEIHLEPVVLELLIYLIANRERLVTRQELMDTVWGDTVISESALTKAVARLREALDDDPACRPGKPVRQPHAEACSRAPPQSSR